MEILPFNSLLFDHPAKLLAFYDPIFHTGKAKLFGWQIRINKDFATRFQQEPKHILATCPNGAGKSSVIMSAPALWTAVSFQESRTVITSSSIPQLDMQTMPAVKRLAGLMNEYHKEELWEVQHRYLFFKPNKSEIIARKSDEEGTMEGFHPINPGGEFTILVDEGKSISEPVYKGILKWTGWTRRIDVTSAGDPSGYYYGMWGDPHFMGTKWQIIDDDCPNITAADKQKIIAAAGGIDAPLAQQVLKSQFVALAGTVVVTLGAVKRCIELGQKNAIEWRKEDLNRAGLDLSGGGDENVVSIWNGNKQIGLECFNFGNELQIEDHIAYVIIPKYDLRMDRIWADAGGLGRAMIRHIEEKVTKQYGGRYGQKMNMVYNQSQPLGILKKNFANRGTESWFHLGVMIQGGHLLLIDDAKQTQQLANRYYDQQSASDKILVEPKAKTRANGRPSPDRADATVMALCRYDAVAPVEYKEQKKGLTGPELEQWMEEVNAKKFANQRKQVGGLTLEHLTGRRGTGTRISDLMRRK